jgi:AbiV family abortive infection protein
MAEINILEKNKIIRNCLSNAETLIASAEEMKEKRGRRNIAYTLAALGLEEVGKASILKSVFVFKESDVESTMEINFGMDDHKMKLFWAFWGASFAKEEITQTSINKYKGLASMIHHRRLEYLYTNIESSKRPVIKTKELDNMISLARARLMIEKSYRLPTKIDKKKAKLIKWFLEASQDIERHKLIFGNKSIRKLEEFKDGRLWIDWLYDEFQKAEDKSKKLIQSEMSRKKPQGNAVYKDKWEVEVRLNCQSHSLKNSALDEWNKNINSPKLYLANKNELIVKFILPASVHVSKIWDVSLDLMNQFLIALNVGAIGGIIFRNIPRDSAKFHSKVIDLDNKREIIVELGQKLNINWKEAKWILDKAVLLRVQRIMFLLYTDSKADLKLNTHLMKYLQGVIMFSKTDIHLRLEFNAFYMFMDCLIGLLKEDNPTITDMNIKQKVSNVFHLDSYDEFNRYLDVWSQLHIDMRTSEEITLTDVIGAKMFCDLYILEKAQRNEEKLSKDDAESKNPA